MAAISVIKNFSNWVKNVSLESILNDIKQGTFKDQIKKIRTLIKSNNKEQADILKKQLIAFTPSGTFNNGRNAKDVTSYSGYIILDIDKLDETQLKDAIKTSRIAPYTYASFISPSGNGLKILVKVNSNQEHHKKAFKQVAAYYKQALNLEIDNSGSDISRLCFTSFDPDCFIKKTANIFQVDIVSHKKSKAKDSTENSYNLFQKCIDFTNKVTSYYEGNRNNYIHQLACNCNRAGIYEVDTENYTTQIFDLNTTEIKTAVKSAYKNNIQDFATFATFANYQTENEYIANNDDSRLLNMPYLPNHIFNKLPNILKEGCKVFNDKRERDVFFTGAITILSGCMNTVSGGYRGKTNFANIFSFVIAPAASGKGSLTYAKDLAIKYHERLIAQSEERLKNYKIEEREYRKKLSNKNIDTASLEIPVEPPFKVLYIPANSSSSRVIQHLKEGDEMGIFCETEADSMGNVLKQDWGGYSDLLRKAFQHEPITLSRKSDKEYSDVKTPRLSVALAGTPGQVQNLIKSAEDGLFSRFLFYTFKTDLKWIDADENLNGVNLTEHFESLSIEVLSFIDFLNNFGAIKFKLLPDHWVRLNNFGRENLITLGTFVSEDLAGTTKRLGLILFRLSMILTALRYYDNGECATEFTCTNEDFEIALALIKIYTEHSVFMFNELPKSGDVTDKVLKHFFDSLPLKFRRKDAIIIADNKFQIKERTADLYLKKLVKAEYLEKIKSGFYQKIK